MDSISTRFEMIAANTLDPNPWNPNVMDHAMRAKLRRELERGVLAPLLVRPMGERYQIIDGEHRYRIARELGIEVLPCMVAPLSDRDARLKTLQMNGLHGENDPDRLAALLRELREELTSEALAAALPFTAAEIDQMAAMAADELRRLDLTAMAPPPPAECLFVAVVSEAERDTIEHAIRRERAVTGASEGAALAALCERSGG